MKNKKKAIICLLFCFIIILTLCFFLINIITSYENERISDDISNGYFGFLFRAITAIYIIVSEIEILHDILYFISDRKKKYKTIFNILCCILASYVIITVLLYYLFQININSAYTFEIGGFYLLIRFVYIVINNFFHSF